MNTDLLPPFPRQQNKKASFDESSTIDSRRSFAPPDYRRKFKMEICKAWRDQGFCLYGDTCAFAHGEHELRDRALIAPSKYKTKLCYNFFEKSCCSYGKRCQFDHTIPQKHKPIIHFERKFSHLSELERLEAGSIGLETVADNIEDSRLHIFRKLSNGISCEDE